MRRECLMIMICFVTWLCSFTHATTLSMVPYHQNDTNISFRMNSYVFPVGTSFQFSVESKTAQTTAAEVLITRHSWDAQVSTFNYSLFLLSVEDNVITRTIQSPVVDIQTDGDVSSVIVTMHMSRGYLTDADTYTFSIQYPDETIMTNYSKHVLVRRSLISSANFYVNLEERDPNSSNIPFKININNFQYTTTAGVEIELLDLFVFAGSPSTCTVNKIDTELTLMNDSKIYISGIFSQGSSISLECSSLFVIELDKYSTYTIPHIVHYPFYAGWFTVAAFVTKEPAPAAVYNGFIQVGDGEEIIPDKVVPPSRISLMTVLVVIIIISSVFLAFFTVLYMLKKRRDAESAYFSSIVVEDGHAYNTLA